MKIDEKRSFAKSFHRPSHGEKTYQESPHQTYSIENSLYIDKDFLKNNIGESLITLKAKYIKYLNYIYTNSINISKSTSHFIKDSSDNTNLIGAFQNLRIFGNRIKKKPLEIFETNLLINFMEKMITYILEKKNKLGDFNFMIVFTVFIFSIVCR